MKRLAITVVLVCVLASVSFAGNMPTTGVVGPTPPPATGETSTPPGETQTPPGETQGPSLLATVILTIITWPR